MNETIVKEELSLIETKGRCFEMIMNIYKSALIQVFEDITKLKDTCNNIYSITKRVKEPDSIMKKMKKKHYKPNYTNLIEKIQDIAGIRVICPLKQDVYIVKELIEKLPKINILKEKDYITKPKKSGYSAYHLIVETPVIILEKQVLVKVEIQIRTMAMDFWATNEHDIRYKTNKKISALDSKKLSLYARIINSLDDKIMKISQKQRYRTRLQIG